MVEHWWERFCRWFRRATCRHEWRWRQGSHIAFCPKCDKAIKRAPAQEDPNG